MPSRSWLPPCRLSRHATAWSSSSWRRPWSGWPCLNGRGRASPPCRSSRPRGALRAALSRACRRSPGRVRTGHRVRGDPLLPRAGVGRGADRGTQGRLDGDLPCVSQRESQRLDQLVEPRDRLWPVVAPGKKGPVSEVPGHNSSFKRRRPPRIRPAPRRADRPGQDAHRRPGGERARFLLCTGGSVAPSERRPAEVVARGAVR